MARELKVVIVGDSRSLEKALGRSTKATETFGSRLKGMGKAAALGAGAAGIGLLVVGLEKSIKAAEEDQKAMARLEAAFKASGVSAKANAGNIEEAEAAGRKLGFTNTEVLSSLSRLIIPTRNMGLAAKDLGIAQDFARFKGISLAAATQVLTGALAGNQRAIKQLGIVVPPVTDAMDALRAAHEGVKGPMDAAAVAAAKFQDKLATGQAIIDIVSQKVRGQGDAFAATAAGGMAQFSAQLENVEAKIGQKLLPIFNQVLQWVNTHWPEISATIDTACKVVGRVLDAVVPIVRGVIREFKGLADFVIGVFTGDWERAWGGIKNIVFGAVDAIKGVMNALISFLRGPASTVWNAVSSAAEAAFKAVKVAYDNSFAPVFSALKSAMNWIRDNAAAVWNTLKAAIEAVAGPIETVLGGISSAISAVKSAIDALISAYNALSDIAGSVGDAISPPTTKVAPGKPHKGVGAASGGIFDAVPGGMYRFVEAGHPEAVIPLDPAKRSRALGLMGEVMGHISPGARASVSAGTYYGHRGGFMTAPSASSAGPTHITMEVNGRVLGEIALDHIGRVERFGGNVKIRRR